MNDSLENILDMAGIKWDDVSNYFKHKTVNPHSILLNEGEVSENIFLIVKGSVRLWNNDDGDDITMQFFFENQMVASFESFYLKKESIFTIESVEKTDLLVLSKKHWNELLNRYPKLNGIFKEWIIKRFMEYSKLFLSRIKDTPEERYINLVEEKSIILKRIPDYYIASYLGITPVSLSRIKNRVKKF